MTDTTTAPPAPSIFGSAIASEVERQIAEKVVRDLLAAGFRISVNDGEETTLVASRDLAAISAAMATTDEDWLIVHRPDRSDTLGWVRLIYGNEECLISDYIDHPELAAALRGAEQLAERFGA